MHEQAERGRTLVADFCNAIVAPTGTPGDPEQWVHVAKARAGEVGPITAIVNTELLLAAFAGQNWLFQTDLKFQWSDDLGGGEAIVDAGSGVVVTVGGSYLEIWANHKAVIPIGGLPGPSAKMSVTIFNGTVPHPRPVRSQRIDVAAGATSAKLQVPRYTYLSRIETVPEVTNQLIFRGYQSAAVAAPVIQEVSGRNPLVMMSGIDFVDLQNTSPINRTALVIHELCL